MPDRAAPLRPAVITRTVRAVAAAGLKVTRVEVEGGRVVVYTGEAAAEAPASPLDAWRREQDAGAA